MTSPSERQASVLSPPDEAAFVLEKGQSSIRTVRTFSTPRPRAHEGCFAPLLWRLASGRSHWRAPPPVGVRADRLAGADHPARWSSLQPVTAPAVTIGSNMRRDGATPMVGRTGVRRHRPLFDPIVQLELTTLLGGRRSSCSPRSRLRSARTCAANGAALFASAPTRLARSVREGPLPAGWCRTGTGVNSAN